MRDHRGLWKPPDTGAGFGAGDHAPTTGDNASYSGALAAHYSAAEADQGQSPQKKRRQHRQPECSHRFRVLEYPPPPARYRWLEVEKDHEELIVCDIHGAGLCWVPRTRSAVVAAAKPRSGAD